MHARWSANEGHLVEVACGDTARVVGLASRCLRPPYGAAFTENFYACINLSFGKRLTRLSCYGIVVIGIRYAALFAFTNRGVSDNRFASSWSQLRQAGKELQVLVRVSNQFCSSAPSIDVRSSSISARSVIASQFSSTSWDARFQPSL